MISLIQTAEGALNETHAILQRMRELSVQSANDTNTTEQDRLEIQKEVDQLAEEITRISTDTEFNTQSLLNGDFKDKTFHIGANSGQSIDVTIANMSAAELGVHGTARDAVVASGSIQGINITSDDDTNYKINIVQGAAAADDTATATASLDADTNVITVTLAAGNISGDNVDLDGLTAALDGVTGISASLDAGATNTDLAVAGSANVTGGQAARAEGQGGLYVGDQESADAAITTLDAAINKVSAERSKLGAVQNRLEHTINNLGTSAENLTAAESRIRDVDYDLAAA